MQLNSVSGPRSLNFPVFGETVLRMLALEDSLLNGVPVANFRLAFFMMSL